MVRAMKRTQINNNSVSMAVWLLIATCASANDIFERATCPEASYTQCTNAGLPSDFCCPSTSTCIPLAQNTTLLCCPSGNDCSIIQPITCDITTQNITLHPDNTLKTTALTATMDKCRDECCPFGYSCVDGNCAINVDQADSVPGQSVSSSSTSSPSTALPSTTNGATGASATASSKPSSTPPSAASATPVAIIPTNTCDKFPVSAILAGFFPGIAIGVLLSLLGLFCLGVQRRKAARRKSGSSFGNNISDPVPTGDVRTDFLRKMPATSSTSASSTPRRNNTITRVKSLFRRSNVSNTTGASYQNSPMPGQGAVPPIPLNYQNRQAIPEERPVTPRLQREPSYEDINIFADGDTASALRARAAQQKNLGVPSPSDDDVRAPSSQTTFTDMMERSGLAGLQKGQRTYQHIDEHGSGNDS